ncbi:MAG TPA: helix-turn-helix domain-containing protein, partial [Chitinophagaceae bacterium]|nr:helix-turn-helix domain-containing protein [Chitinophagaceae bacterium]
TARAEDGDKMTGLETGADAYLVKPFNSKELLVRVKNLITLRNRMRAKFSGRLVVKPSEIAVTPVDEVFLEKLLQAVEAHIEDRQFTVEVLSRAVNMSTSQLNRKLKAIINQPATQFIRSVRLQRAMKMLKKEAGTISEIAFKTGFETPSYFTKMFKAQFGCLPSEKEKFPEDA